MLKINNLSVSYSSLILDSLDMEFKEGEITAIIGKNGSGKSTLLKCIDGLVENNACIYLDDLCLNTLSIKERAKYISYLPQNRPISSISGRLMIEHGRFPHLSFNKKLKQEDYDIIEKAIKDTNVSSIVNKRLNEMSGGELQKIYIATTLAQQSQIILLDEPTNHLDLESQIEILKLIKKIKKENKIIIIVLHDLLQAFTFADKIYLINDHKVVLSGKPDDIKDDKKIETIFKYKLIEDNDKNSLYKYKLIEK